jgi:hypothetical protein
VKKSEIDECLRLYRRALEAVLLLKEKLQATRAAADGIPILARSKRRMEEAERDLDQIGEGLAVLPEVAQALIEEKRLAALLRREAEKRGIVLRYDTA